MIWSIIICVVIVGVFCFLGYKFFCAADPTTTKDNFLKAKDAAREELIQKKNAAIKEMDDELREKRQQIDAAISSSWQELEQTKQENANKIKFLSEKYDQEKTQLEQTIQEQRQKILDENTAHILSERQKFDIELAQLTQRYNDEKEKLSLNFSTFSDEINLKKATLTEQIKAFEDKQSKIIEQFKKDDEARNQREFYKITIDSTAAQDISKLKELALTFSKPEILYKLIYETYYKTPLEAMFKRVLGENKDCGGIYKITNINSEKVYVGKTNNFLIRWRTHAKRGCNIERISGEIYEAMFNEGLENFMWEIIEICSKEQQTEKEKYWIDFYKSNRWGYNIRKG